VSLRVHIASGPGVRKEIVFDVIFFKYDEKGKQHPLLTNKTAKIFATCDGPSFFYKFPFVSLRFSWSKARLGFCGIKVKKVIIFDKS
jgi:putative NADPH-quinone reductase